MAAPRPSFRQSRQQPSSSSTTNNPSNPANPMESLIQSLIPSLAGPSTQPRGRDGVEGARLRDLGQVTTGAEEVRRGERRKELGEWGYKVLDSYASSPSNSTSRSNLLSSLRQSVRAGSKFSSAAEGGSASDKIRELEKLVAELEGGNVLSDPSKHLQFLLSLSPHYTGSSSFIASTSRLANLNINGSGASTPGASGSNGKGKGPGSKGGMEGDEMRGLTRAEILDAWRSKQGTSTIPTHLLLRDTLYLLQGINGTHVRFAVKSKAQKEREQNPYNREVDFTRKEDRKVEKERRKEKKREWLLLGGGGEEGEEEEITGLDFVDIDGQQQDVSPSLKTTIVELAELGMLYRRVYDFVRVAQAKAGGTASDGGMVRQSLCHFLQQELSAYHSLLSTLENQLSLPSSRLPESNTSITTSTPSSSIANNFPAEDSGMTFMKLGLWTEEAILKMRMMSTLVDEAQGARGGALISAIHAHTMHGDPSVREFADRVLEEVSKPFFQSLENWISSGQLHDPFNEFFVQLNPALVKRGNDKSTPFINDMTFASAIPFAPLGGETSNDPHMIWERRYIFVKSMLPSFISEEFGRKIFVTGKSINFIRFSCHDNDWMSLQAQENQVDRVLGHDDVPNLERTIDAAYSTASKHLQDIFFDRYKLLDHIEAMRRYILLCAGDFADILLENLSPRLDRDAGKLLRHHLASDIETAISGSNARHEPEEILRRLDAQIMSFGPGAIGWDCFTLQYKVEAPLNAVIDDAAVVDYDRIFMHLWKVRRTAASLRNRWLRSTYEPRAFKHLEGYTRVWHICHMLQAEMTHFIAELQAFCQLEAIELAWQDLSEFSKSREGDLDALIGAHRTYLKGIIAKALLANPRDPKDNSLERLVGDLMAQIMSFGRKLDALYNLSVAEKTRITRQAEIERGVLPASSMADTAEATAAQLADLEKQIKDQAKSFRSKMMDLISGLESNSNYEVKFLAVRLSFNGMYTERKKTGTAKPSSRAVSS